VLEQVRQDARLFDDWALAVGPLTRLDANAVAAAEGKTRGAIRNLFGSQAAFQTETMAHVLSAGDWIERIEYPEPRGAAADAPLGVSVQIVGEISERDGSFSDSSLADMRPFSCSSNSIVCRPEERQPTTTRQTLVLEEDGVLSLTLRERA
jgi:hypothetical protein